LSIKIESLYDANVSSNDAESIAYDIVLKEISELNNNLQFIESAISAATYIGMYHLDTNTIKFSPNGRKHLVFCLNEMLGADYSNYNEIIERHQNNAKNEIKAQRGIL